MEYWLPAKKVASGSTTLQQSQHPKTLTPFLSELRAKKLEWKMMQRKERLKKS